MNSAIVGRVHDAGGGLVNVLVDRDTESYPKIGDRVWLTSFEVEGLLRAEIERWQRIALYLGHCHVATALELADLKSTPKTRRARLANICRRTWRYLARYEQPPGPHYSLGGMNGAIEDLMRRSHEAYTACGKGDGESVSL